MVVGSSHSHKCLTVAQHRPVQSRKQDWVLECMTTMNLQEAMKKLVKVHFAAFASTAPVGLASEQCCAVGVSGIARGIL